jgi:hypothetical protein
VTVTILDALVLARSAFEHSANYDSAVLFGHFSPVEPRDRMAAFEAFTEAILPGRWSEVRGPNGKELRATAILAMRIDEASVKTRSGPPDDDESKDAELDVWAGVLPVKTVFGPPQASPGLRAGLAPSESVQRAVAHPR